MRDIVTAAGFVKLSAAPVGSLLQFFDAISNAGSLFSQYAKFWPIAIPPGASMWT
jgi:hypothetical protein